MLNKKRILITIGIIVSILIFASGQLFAAGKKKIILIDPAHGGKDQGVKLNNDVFEKDITLTVALLIKKALARENNVELYLTRESDEEVDLEDRRDIIKKIKPDFFLSLHVNGGFGKEASGFELYYPEFSEDAVKGKKAKKENVTQLRNKCQGDSLKMAKIIQENMNALFPRKGRGLRKADMPITDGLLVPAVSVEMGFATNPEDKKKLLAVKTQTEIAKALANSIKSFYR
ncbi:n-acetylmuramoyl-l-alanine amidase [hydrocarbon metagenome]|uniref:N-acetylmuramoyl-l-alanine amidase n=1 Tax=hydrocarbon metagenome TaxID=938273 RepID=A0A0W8FTW6_9ZZZZ